jgi:hypothetical protein
MSKKKKITSKKKSKAVETGFATLEDLIMGKPTKKVRRKTRKSKAKVIVKTPTIVEERPLYIKHYLEIVSLITNEEGFLEEIIFTYKGVLVIPLSLKDIYKADSHTTQSTFTIPKNIKDPILTKRFDNLTKKETLNFLKDHVNDTYMVGLKEVIYKEVWPEHKIIDQLPWK